MTENSTYASSRITATWRGSPSTNSSISSTGSAVAVGLFGLQTTTMRVACVTSRAIASRSCRPAASSGTVIARAPVIAARCGYIENDGHA